ncbi:hypothetical protein [Sphingomonas sp. LM7]|uniref:hypothetical protein n=1 Tax=Sphingomonas sp. LM7 TaxID=1938607 RepID=UPI000983B115|nr:hypothetical protein [Sphingomonas sp. LM7]AQR74261.1 hypothetical protein BXU08_11905 [Sphingomonas sp. LM7]
MSDLPSPSLLTLPHWTLRTAAKPYARWSADTDQAFLLALRLTGQVRAAAAAIGRSISSAYQRRQRDADFAARWDLVVDEQQAAWIVAQHKAAQALEDVPLGDHRVRRDGWSEARRKLFLRALSETGSVRDACARARISSTAAYTLRRKCARFATDWAAALDTQAVTVEQVAFERAVLGWEEPIVQSGQIVGQRWRFSETLLRALFQQAQRAEASAQPGRRGTTFVKPMPTREETNAALAKAIAAAEKRMLAEAALEQAGGAERWRDAEEALSPPDG